MNLNSLLKIVSFLVLISFVLAQIPNIRSFEELGEYHCNTFPIQILYRLSSGTLAQKYGSQYAQIDCYVRQFVNQDGQNKEQYQQQQEEEQDQQQNQSQQNQQQNQYKYPEVDPIVQNYAKGLINCLPQNIDSVNAVYRIWRFYRYLVQHDYAYEWMRAKVRSGLGYQAQKPNAWMDGQQNQKRLRLDKLFSNQFYDYVDKLMFKDFLFPLMTFLRKNVVVGVQGQLTTTRYPILFQYIQSRNVHEKVFKPIIFTNSETKNLNIFTFTLPGIPLFLGGTSTKVAWAYTGVLVDRSNIEQIQTVGNKFYHHGIQQWVKLNDVQIQIPVHNSQPYTCKYMHSSYGTLYEKHNRSGKISEYIARWHEDQRRVRNLFSETFNLILNQGNAERDFDFPFNSMVIANQSGVFNYLCQQYHPSYFIYPDLASQPDALPTRWIKQPKKHFFAIANTHLTTINQNSYIKKEILNQNEQQIVIEMRRLIKQKINLQNLWNTILNISTDPLLKKRKEHLIYMYRKAKFVFFPQEEIRKQCDQLISIVQKWDNNLANEINSVVFILWDYFFREYTMNHVSSSALGAHIVKHRVLTDSYWTGQAQLWKKGISYGECDSHEWHSQGWDVRLNGTGLNCTCFFNIMRGINKTRQILRNDDGSINQNYKLSDFKQKKIIDLSKQYKGDHIDEALGNFYSKNMAFVAEIGNPHIITMHSYQQAVNKIDLNAYASNKVNPTQQKEIDPIDSDL